MDRDWYIRTNDVSLNRVGEYITYASIDYFSTMCISTGWESTHPLAGDCQKYMTEWDRMLYGATVTSGDATLLYC